MTRANVPPDHASNWRSDLSDIYCRICGRYRKDEARICGFCATEPAWEELMTSMDAAEELARERANNGVDVMKLVERGLMP